MSRKKLQGNRGQPPLTPYDPRRSQNPAAVRDDVCYLYDLPIGDAGAGEKRMKRRTIFSRLFDNVDEATLNPFERLYPVVQDPPLNTPYDTCRYKMFNVKFWGQSLIRMGNTGDELFTPLRENAALANGPSNPWDMVPTPLQGYIQTDDGMYYVFDIVGRRSFEVYATHVDAGILAPVASYDASALPNDGSKDTAFDGIVDQSYVGVSVSSVVVNSTQREDDGSRNIRLTDAAEVLIPIIPGARAVCISAGRVAGGGAVTASFTWNPTLLPFKGFADIPVDAEIVPAGQTRPLCIPGAPFLRLATTSTSPVQVGITFMNEL